MTVIEIKIPEGKYYKGLEGSIGHLPNRYILVHIRNLFIKQVLNNFVPAERNKTKKVGRLNSR